VDTLRRRGSIKGDDMMERNGMVWDSTGWFGTERRDIHNRRAQVRFLSHLPREPEFIEAVAL
jgi:hypothetical protein